MAAFRFTYDGRTHTFDPDSLSVAEAREIKTHAGMSIAAWQAGLEDADVDALVGLVYTAVRRGGQDLAWSDLDGMNLVALANSMVTDNDLDPEALARGEAPVLPGNRAARRVPAEKRATPGKKPASKSPR